MEKKLNIQSEESQEDLVKSFNLRDENAYSYVYTLYYDSLYYFASHLFSGTEIDASDLVHDIFLSLWENKKTNFSSLDHIKSYFFLSVRNRYRKYWEHKKHVDEYTQKMIKSEDYFISEMIEVEVISNLSTIINLLPNECSKVLKMYIEGLEIKEIAQILGKSQSTVYNQKNDAVEFLRKKLNRTSFLLLISILG